MESENYSYKVLKKTLCTQIGNNDIRNAEVVKCRLLDDIQKW